MANREIFTLGSLTALTLVSIAALVLSPSASGTDTAAGNELNPNHVPGEKLDSGLGELPPYRSSGDNRDRWAAKTIAGRASR